MRIRGFLAACLCFTFFYPFTSKAQTDAGFSPDCPGATTGVSIMPRWKIDWETGCSHEWNNRNGAHERTLTINTSTFRLGVGSGIELRLQADWCATHTPNESYMGVANAAIGTKVKVFNGNNALPKVSFMGMFLIPGGSGSHYLPQHLALQAHLLFENGLSKRLTLGYDAGVEWSGNGDKPNVFLGVNLTLQQTERLSFYVESYNLYNANKQADWAKPGHSSHFNCMCEIGAAFMVTPRLQLNAYCDASLNEPSKYANLGIGMAWLIN